MARMTEDQEVDKFVRSFSTYRGSLSKDVEYDLIDRAKRGSNEALEALLRQHAQLVLRHAKRMQGRGLPLWDLFSEGQFGLLNAIDGFDPTLGFRLSTYATWWIRQAIGRAIANQGRAIRLPVHIQEFLTGVRKAEQRLRNARGIEGDAPSEEDITDEILANGGVPKQLAVSRESLLKKVRAVRASPAFLSLIELDRPIETGEDLGSLYEVIEEKIADDGLESFLRGNEREVLSAAVRHLSPREQAVIIARFFEGKTLDKTASAIVNPRSGQTITRERARQLEANAIKKLRKSLSSWYKSR